MISVQIDIDEMQVQQAMLDVGERNPAHLAGMIAEVVESHGDPEFALALIGKLEIAYIYLQETFGEG
jgi:hypothetical protein